MPPGALIIPHLDKTFGDPAQNVRAPPDAYTIPSVSLPDNYMESFAQQIQQTALAQWVSGSGALYGYPLFLFLHTLGLATIAGLSAGINLRLLGMAPAMKIAPMVRFFPVMWTAFVITVISGMALLLSDPVTRLGQTIFYVKLLLVLLAVINMDLIRRRIFTDAQIDDRPFPPIARTLAISSMVLWIAATTAGRLIAYL